MFILVILKMAEAALSSSPDALAELVKHINLSNWNGDIFQAIIYHQVIIMEQ